MKWLVVALIFSITPAFAQAQPKNPIGQTLVIDMGNGKQLTYQGPPATTEDLERMIKLLKEQEQAQDKRRHPFIAATGFYWVRSHIWTPINDWGQRNNGMCVVAGTACGVGANALLGARGL